MPTLLTSAVRSSLFNRRSNCNVCPVFDLFMFDHESLRFSRCPHDETLARRKSGIAALTRAARLANLERNPESN